LAFAPAAVAEAADEDWGVPEFDPHPIDSTRMKAKKARSANGIFPHPRRKSDGANIATKKPRPE
jgi:hypothetical protein